MCIGHVSPIYADRLRKDRVSLVAYNIRGLLFDMDGLLVDTTILHFHSWARIAEEEGLTVPTDPNIFRGLSREHSLNIILQGRELSEETRRGWMERKNRYFLETAKHIQPLPGVIPLLMEAKQNGYVLAVGSSSRNARLILELLNLSSFFVYIGDAYCVPYAKPAPDLFLHVAQMMELPPSQILILEDGAVGVKAALAGGFPVIGVGPVKIHGAERSLPSLSGIRVADLLALLV
jgi:beta-phosphoglucomutase